MKNELTKIMITSSLSLTAVSCEGDRGAQGNPGIVPLGTLNIDVSINCPSNFSNPAICNVTNNESEPVFCSVSAVNFVNDPSTYNNTLVNPGSTLSTQMRPSLSSSQLCDVLCWNDTGMIKKDVAHSC